MKKLTVGKLREVLANLPEDAIVGIMYSPKHNEKNELEHDISVIQNASFFEGKIGEDAAFVISNMGLKFPVNYEDLKLSGKIL